MRYQSYPVLLKYSTSKTKLLVWYGSTWRQRFSSTRTVMNSPDITLNKILWCCNGISQTRLCTACKVKPCRYRHLITHIHSHILNKHCPLRLLFIVFFVQICIDDYTFSVHRKIKIFTIILWSPKVSLVWKKWRIFPAFNCQQYTLRTSFRAYY